MGRGGAEYVMDAVTVPAEGDDAVPLNRMTAGTELRGALRRVDSWRNISQPKRANAATAVRRDSDISKNQETRKGEGGELLKMKRMDV